MNIRTPRILRKRQAAKHRYDATAVETMTFGAIPDPDWEDTLDGRRVRHLYDEALRLRRDGLYGDHWVMGARSYDALLSLRDRYGVRMIPEGPGPVSLLGYRIEVIPGAGAPALLPRQIEYVV